MLDASLSQSLKREALMFDRLAIPNLHLLTRNDTPQPNLTHELEYLIEKGIVFEPSIRVSPFPQDNAPDPDLMGEEYRRCLRAEEYWFSEMMASDRPRMKFIDYTNSAEADGMVRNLQATLALQYHTRRVSAYLIVALGTGMRMREQLRIKRHQVDFLRNILTARDTKNGRPRDIPMNDDVREALAELCRDKRPNDYVFVSPKTGSCLTETKKGSKPPANQPVFTD